MCECYSNPLARVTLSPCQAYKADLRFISEAPRMFLVIKLVTFCVVVWIFHLRVAGGGVRGVGIEFKKNWGIFTGYGSASFAPAHPFFFWYTPWKEVSAMWSSRFALVSFVTICKMHITLSETLECYAMLRTVQELNFFLTCRSFALYRRKKQQAQGSRAWKCSKWFCSRSDFNTYRKSSPSRSIKYAPSSSSSFNSNLPENIAQSMESGSFLRVSSVVL